MPRGFTYKHCSVAKEHPHLKGCPPHTFGSTSYIWSNVIQMSTHQASQDGIGHLRILCWFECAEMVEQIIVVVSPLMFDQNISLRPGLPSLSGICKAPLTIQISGWLQLHCFGDFSGAGNFQLSSKPRLLGGELQILTDNCKRGHSFINEWESS